MSNIFNSIITNINTTLNERKPLGFRDVLHINLMPSGGKFNMDAARMDNEVKMTRLGESELSRWLKSINMDISMLISVRFDFVKVELDKAIQGLKRNPSPVEFKAEAANEQLVAWYWRCLNTIRLNEIMTNGLTIAGEKYVLLWQSSSQAKANEIELINIKHLYMMLDWVILGLPDLNEKIGKKLVRLTLGASNGKELFRALPKMEEYLTGNEQDPAHHAIVKDTNYRTAEYDTMDVRNKTETKLKQSWDQKITDGVALMFVDNRQWDTSKQAQYYTDAARGLVGIWSGRTDAAGKNCDLVMLRSGIDKIVKAHGLDPEELEFTDIWGDSHKLSNTTWMTTSAGWKFAGNFKNWEEVAFRISVRERDKMNVCTVPHIRKLGLSYQANQYLYLDNQMKDKTVARSMNMLYELETDESVNKLVMPEMREAVKEFPALLGDATIKRMVETNYHRNVKEAAISIPKVAKMRLVMPDPESLTEVMLGLEPTVRIKAGQCIIPYAPKGWVLACRYPVSGATWTPLYNIGVPEGMEDIYATAYSVYVSFEDGIMMRLQMDFDGDKLVLVLPENDYNKSLIEYVRKYYENNDRCLTCTFDIASDKRPYTDELFKQKMLTSESSRVGVTSDAQAMVNLNYGDQDYTLQKDITAEVDMGKGAAPDEDTIKARGIAQTAYAVLEFPPHVKLSKGKVDDEELFQLKEDFFMPDMFPNSWAERYAHDLMESIDVDFNWNAVTVPEWVQYKPGQKALKTPSWKMLCCGDIRKLSLYSTAKAIGEGKLNFNGSLFGSKIQMIKRAEAQMSEDKDMRYKCVNLVEEEVERVRADLFAYANQIGVSHDAIINSLVMEIYQSGDSDTVKDEAKRMLWKCFWQEMTENIRANKAAGKYPDIDLMEELTAKVKASQNEEESLDDCCFFSEDEGYFYMD